MIKSGKKAIVGLVVPLMVVIATLFVPLAVASGQVQWQSRVIMEHATRSSVVFLGREGATSSVCTLGSLGVMSSDEIRAMVYELFESGAISLSVRYELHD